MSEDETLYLGITGYLCGLCSRAVECLLCKKGMLLREGGFVVQAGDAVDEFCESGAVCPFSELVLKIRQSIALIASFLVS